MQPYPPAVDFAHGSLKVSSNGRFLQHADGTPFFWLGDTAWEMCQRLKREETDLFLETRRRQRFNVIQVVALAEFNGLRTPNRYGELPLIDLDPDKPNDAYFKHVDWVIDLVASKGLYIGLLPTWGDKVVRDAWGEDQSCSMNRRPDAGANGWHGATQVGPMSSGFWAATGPRFGAGVRKRFATTIAGRYGAPWQPVSRPPLVAARS